MYTSSSNPVSVVQSPPPSRLLQLPGELRNKIFKYALTADQGLYHIAATQTQPPRFIAPYQAGCKACRDAFGDKDMCTSPNYPELNQLKYVCRQLRHETAGLEVKFNRVEFRSYNDKMGPAQIFAAFLEDCSPVKASWFKNVTLSCVFETSHSYKSLVESPTHLIPIADFCRKNPASLVRYIPSDLKPGAYTMGVHGVTEVDLNDRKQLFGNWAGMFLARVLRSTAVVAFPLDGLHTFFTQFMSRKWCTSAWFHDRSSAAEMQEPNLRFFPWTQAGEVGEEGLRIWEVMSEEQRIAGMFERTRMNVEVVKGWCVHGI